MNKPFTGILLGPPGSGKSTQAGILVRELGFSHIDVGSALRKASGSDTPLGKKIAEIMNRHMGLVSDDVIRAILSDTLFSILDDQSAIIDGAPRCASQMDLIVDVLSEYDRTIGGVIFINLSEEESIRRISNRWMCQHCNQMFVAEVDFLLSEKKCPSCSGTLVRREDDTEEGVRKRFRVFFENTLPVIEEFRLQNVLFEVDGSCDVQFIADRIREYVGRSFHDEV